jgi:excisionase family DNA binding protein
MHCTERKPLAVSPREAFQMLGIGNTYGYELIANGELESYKDGRLRRITMRSIEARLERLLIESKAVAA